MRSASSRVAWVVVSAAIVAACSSSSEDINGGGSDDAGADLDTGTSAHDSGGVVGKDSGAKSDSGTAGDAGHDSGKDAGPVAASCSDKIKNGEETDVDCGGSCPQKCALTKGCKVVGDCVAGAFCNMGVCAAQSCMDGIMDGTETAIDCGGASCPACGDGLACNVPADCQSKDCVGNACLPATNTDGIQNEGETAIDCGGPNAPPCADGLGCAIGSDCIDKVCDAVKKTCTAASCSDGVQNGAETAIDCGGGTCAACADGMVCAVGSDCKSGVCAGTCQPASCMDGVQNQDETDVDCGGNICGPCADNMKCKVGKDCIDGACGGGTCTAPSCTDGAKNGQETDVDCGGPTCPRCDLGKTCATGSDCAYNICGAGNTCSTASSCGGGGNGRATCGPAGNEDCCTTLPVPGGSIGAGASKWTVSPYRLDKYEITVGRMRTFLASKGWNLRGNPPAPGAGAHAKIPGSGWLSTWNDRLPAGNTAALAQQNVLQRSGVYNGNATQDSGLSDCFGGEDAATWTNSASANDQKAANCFDWYTLFAFCEWDGGYLPTEREWQYAAQGGTDNRTFAWGSAPATPKATDWLPRCGNAGDGPCQDPNVYMGAAYSNNNNYPNPQPVDAAYPTFLQAPGTYVVHGFCTNVGNRACFSYTGANANAGQGALNASHVAPPGQKLDIAKWGQADMSGNLIEWTLDNSVNVNPVTGRQQNVAACVGTDCANLDYVDYHVQNLDPNGTPIVGDTSIPAHPSYWRNWNYANGSAQDLDARFQQDGGRVMRGGSWEIAHPVNITNRYGNYPVFRNYYAAGARCARPY